MQLLLLKMDVSTCRLHPALEPQSGASKHLKAQALACWPAEKPLGTTISALTQAATDRYEGDVEGKKDHGGDVTGINYKLLYKDPITNGDEDEFNVFVLYRKLVNPDETFEHLLEHDPVDPKDLDAKFARYEAGIGDPSNYVCENIFEISVVFTIEYSELENNRLITRIERVPIIGTGGDQAAETFSFTGNGIEVDGDQNAEFNRGRITAVDFSITVLTDNGIATMRKAQFQGSALDKFLAKNSYRYSKTVLLPQP